MAATQLQEPATAHEWRNWPNAEGLLAGWVSRVLAASPSIRAFTNSLERSTSTRLFDWLDHVAVAGADASNELTACGFAVESVPCPPGFSAYYHPDALLPRVLVRAGQGPTQPLGLAVKCESVSDVLLANGWNRPIRGTPLSPFRNAVLISEEITPPAGVEVRSASGRLRLELRAVERCGYRGYVATPPQADCAGRIIQAKELWTVRRRRFEDDGVGMRKTLDAARAMVDLVGPDAAACLAFAVERDYWQRRSHAAVVQKARQDRVGFGWANHDHHTFRSSRERFAALIATMETFGFVCRERFYAGRQAGWGAQILEQPTAGLVVFADVDLAEQEVALDFAHEPLLGRDRLGTVGLWCGLHGESLLQAGMHHLEAQFDFDALRDDLAAAGVGMMKPFSDFEHLRQAFTAPERWPVEPARLHRLLARGLITPEQADQFSREGAVGSHLENLQRRYGFKGFNQQGISQIIKATDPRGLKLDGA